MVLVAKSVAVVSVLLPLWFSVPLGPALPPQVVSPLRLTSDPAWDYHPVVSPDGERVLFTSQRGGEPGLWLVPAEGGQLSRVPVPGSGDLYSDWAPDSESILIDLRGDGGPPDLFRFWFGTGELQRLTDFPGLDAHPSFSPDGQQIVFTSIRAGAMDIWVMNADGTDPRAVLQDAAGDWHPDCSPDGTRVLFTSDRGGEGHIWVVGLDGSGLTQITRGPGPADRASWSPDGSLILFQQNDELWVVSPGGGEPVRLTDRSGREGNGAWSPDGTRIVMSVREGENTDLWVPSQDQALLERARRGGGPEG